MANHLRYAIKVYAESGDSDRAKRAFAELKQVNFYLAAVVEEDDDLRQVLGVER